MLACSDASAIRELLGTRVEYIILEAYKRKADDGSVSSVLAAPHVALWEEKVASKT